MSYPPAIIIGDTVLTPTRRLPTSAFTANSTKVRNTSRAQDGSLVVTDLYEKYTININGVSQTAFPKLRYEYQRNDFIDLYSIVPRFETVSPSGTTNSFVVSRRVRLDDTSIAPVVEYPLGTNLVGTSFSFVNNTTTSSVTLTFTPSAGVTVGVLFYPIFLGVIASMTSDYDYQNDTESYNITFEES